MKCKAHYQAPSIEIIPVEVSNIMADSTHPSVGDVESGGHIDVRSGNYRTPSDLTTFDVEDMINDILTPLQ
jgi:hypothetical protein